jgi:pimeloyl-ACP methyl ester carboxylesterase
LHKSATVAAAGGRELSVGTWGDPRGAPVFLLHGTPGSRFGPRPRPALLYRLGIRLIAYDRPGYGDSDRHVGRSVSEAAADVAAVADAFGIERFAVIGRSGGGPHALACAALLPGRVTRAAVLAGLAPRDAEGLDWFAGMNEANVAAFSVAGRGIEALAERITPRAAAIRANPAMSLPFRATELSGSDLHVLANPGVRTMLVSNFAEAFKHSAAGWIDDVLAFTSTWGFDLSRVAVPTTLWHGGRDEFVPPGHAAWMAGRIPNATLTIDPDAAHFGAMRVLPELLRGLAPKAD